MRLVRLFVDTPLHPGSEISLPEGTARHALRVLRLRTGDPVTLFNGNGQQYLARLTADDPRSARVLVEDTASPVRESPLRVVLLQAVARGEKMDWIIQKAIELGVARIVPMVTERSEVHLDVARGEKRLERWRAVAIAACEQCGRNVVPPIDAPLALSARMAALAGAESEARWMLHPGGIARIRDITPPATNMLLAVGPEGGFGEHDLAVLRAAGFRELTLGPRILRTETAGLAALSALQTAWGDF